MKSLFKSFFLNRFTAKYFLRTTLSLHSFLYKFLTKLAIIHNNGFHPKHKIIKYEEWFLNNIYEGWVILDIGSNTGFLSQKLSKKASYIYGIDIDDNHIKKAISLNLSNNVSYICADATFYDYDGIKIDCIVMSNVLEHIEYRTEFLTSIISKDIWKTKPRFLIRVPMIERDWVVKYKQSLGLDYRLDTTHYIEYTFDEFLEELKEANISIISHTIRFGEIYAICEGNLK